MTTRERVGLGAAIVGLIVAAAFVGAMTWLILMIHSDREGMERAQATVIKVLKTKRSVFGRSVKFGKYTLRIRYRRANGREEEDTIEKSTYWFPSEGDHFTLLVDPRSGHLEASPFPEAWVILVVLYAAFGGFVYMMFSAWRIVLRRDVDRKTEAEEAAKRNRPKLARW